MQAPLLDPTLESESNFQYVSAFDRLPGEKRRWSVNLMFDKLNYTVRVPKQRSGTIRTNFTEVVKLPKYLYSKCFARESDFETVHVLKNMSGVFQAKSSTLLLGPPSSGKTSFFKALCDRLQIEKGSHNFQGDVLFSGYDSKDVMINKTVCFVSQYDNHIPSLTVQQTFDFAYKCSGSKFGNNYPHIMMETLGLLNCKDTVLGSDMIRGVSGGEKKRVTIGEMMFNRQPVLLLDEITTGLDSATATDIIKSIVETTSTLNNTVVISLLQPAPEIFNLFDEVLLLAEGQIIYHGLTGRVEAYFAKLGYSKPPDRPIAEYLCDLASPHRKAYAVKPSAPGSVGELADIWNRSITGLKKQKSVHIERQNSQSHRHLLTPPENEYLKAKSTLYAQTYVEDVKLVVQRQFDILRGNSLFVFALLFQLLFNGLITGALFYQVKLGPDNALDTAWFLQRYNVCFFAVLVYGLNAMAICPFIVEERKIYYKHRASDFFRTSSYIIASAVTQIVLSVFESVIMSVPAFWLTRLVDPQADDAIAVFVKFWLISISMNLVLGVIIRLIALCSATQEQAVLTTSLFIAFSILLSGFNITRNNIPVYEIWLYWLMPVSWGLRSMMIVVFKSDSFDEKLGNIGLDSFDIQSDERWVTSSFIYLCFIYIACLFLQGLAIRTFVFGEVLQRAGQSGYEISKSASSNDDEGDATVSGNGNGRDVTALSIDDSGDFQFQKVYLSFRNLCYTVTTKTGHVKQLLHNIHGYAAPKQMLALIGSTGAGKTTLMDVVVGRKGTGGIAGEILVNGRPKEQHVFKHIVGYVEQTDVHSPHCTVYEALLYSAILNTQGTVPLEKKQQYVLALLRLLDLENLSHLEIGVPSEGGLSPHQAKRVTIGVELASNPSILFLDEPTSGLDAQGAEIVMQTVKNIAKNGRTVVCTIHQPSSDVFELFDAMLVLKRGGHMVYFGPKGKRSSKMFEYLNALNVKLPPLPYQGYNPSTYILEVTGAGVSTDGSAVFDFSEAYLGSDLCRANLNEIQRQVDSSNTYRSFEAFQKVSYWTQFKWLLVKWLRTYWRAPAFTLGRLIIMTLVGILFGCSFIQMKLTDQQKLQSFVGITFLSVVFIGFMAGTSCVPALMLERGVYYRERESGMYSTVIYVLTSMIVEVLYLTVCTLTVTFSLYYIIGLWDNQEAMFTFVYVFWMYIILCNAYGHFMSSLLSTSSIASIMITLSLSLWCMFSGVVINVDVTPLYFAWVHHFSPIYYVLNVLIASQLKCESCHVDMVTSLLPVYTCNGLRRCSHVCSSDPGCFIVSLDTPKGTAHMTAFTFMNAMIGTTDEIERDSVAIFAFIVLFIVGTILSLLFVSHKKQ